MNFNSSLPTLDGHPVVQVPGVTRVPVETGMQREPQHDAPRQKHVNTEKMAELQVVLTQHNISMKFSQNAQTNEVVIQLVDDRTGEAVLQLPNEVSLKLAAANIKLQGQILDETV